MKLLFSQEIEAHLGPRQTSKMELFAKVLIRILLVNYFRIQSEMFDRTLDLSLQDYISSRSKIKFFMYMLKFNMFAAKERNFNNSLHSKFVTFKAEKVIINKWLC